MTYIVVGSNSDSRQERISLILSKSWDREIHPNDISITNPDIHILDGQEVNSIGIEEIKKLQEEMLFKPFKENSQIAIIKDAKKLTPQAQNAFLKTLEESPDQTIYILIVENEKELLPTICSRAKKLYAKEQKGEEILNWDIDIWSKDIVTAFAQIERLSKSKTDSILLLENLRDYLGDVLHKKMKKGIYGGDTKVVLEMVNSSIIKINANCNKRLILENLYLQVKDSFRGNHS